MDSKRAHGIYTTVDKCQALVHDRIWILFHHLTSGASNIDTSNACVASILIDRNGVTGPISVLGKQALRSWTSSSICTQWIRINHWLCFIRCQHHRWKFNVIFVVIKQWQQCCAIYVQRLHVTRLLRRWYRPRLYVNCKRHVQLYIGSYERTVALESWPITVWAWL